jgi:hypothetical protein
MIRKSSLVVLLVFVGIFLLSACDTTKVPTGEMYKVSPLEPGWTREQLNKDPSIYNVSELLPDSNTETSEQSEDSSAISPQQLLYFKTETFITSRTNTVSGNSYLGRLVNQSKYEATVTDTFTKSWSSSVSGGIDVGKIKSTLSISSTYTYTKSVSSKIPAGGRVDVYGQSTGESIKGWQENKLVGTYGCSTVNSCTKKNYTAFKPQGMSIKLY